MITFQNLLNIVTPAGVISSLKKIYRINETEITEYEKLFHAIKKATPVQDEDIFIVEITYVHEGGDEDDVYPISGDDVYDIGKGTFFVNGICFNEEHTPVNPFTAYGLMKADEDSYYVCDIADCSYGQWLSFYIGLNNIMQMSSEDFIAHCLYLINYLNKEELRKR